MDIIPILPAPQQGTMPHPAELSTGTGATGFDQILSRELPAPAPPVQSPEKTANPGGRNNPEISPPEAPPANTGLETTEALESALNEMSEGIPPAEESAVAPTLLQTDDSIFQEFFLPDVLGFIFNRTPADFSAPLTDTLSGSFADFRTVSPLFSATLPNVDQAAPPAGQSADFLQPTGVEANQLSAQPINNTTVSHKIVLELHSSASPFSVKTAESVRVTAEKTIIQGDFTPSIPTLNLGNQRSNTLETRSSASAKPVAVSLQSMDSSFAKNSMPVDKGSFFFESSAISFSLAGKDGRTAAVQTTASTQQPTLMLEELQKLIRHNNDRLTITATLERTPASDRTNLDQLLKLVQENPEQQSSSNENVFKISTSPAPLTALNAQEEAAQTKPQHLRSAILEGFQEQFLNSRSASAAGQSTRNDADQQMLQQHSQSTEGGSQQQASDTAAARSTLPADQATPGSVFASQFHDAGSTQSAETAKVTSPASAHLNQVRDQEIINQIVDRFSLHSRQQTSRLSLQLHPAELGELKIDLIVKGDVLKANIYTQTQQAGEIIDRNLSRLREILQDQGITVDELEVSFKSDSKDDFTPQHGQLFGDQNPLFKGQHRAESASTFAQTIEDTLLTSAQKPPGVNLTI